MESWRKVWREGIAPQLSTAGLEALRGALERDDPALIQGATTSPPALQFAQDWPVEGACCIGWCGWKDGCNTVGEVEDWFARVCQECDQLTGEEASIRWLTNWWDESPREEVRRELLFEVDLVLLTRAGNVADVPAGVFF